jgi:glycosyltransferase involved in cell wall biosynthesis
MNKDINRPWPVKVSVHMPTYNHERFIAQAIDSVLLQRVDFDYEIVIGEDCSTDGTRKIARQYAQAHPGVIRLIEHPQNLGIWENDQTIIAACRGEYIAWLESDDFWTSPDKLQRQVDYLDAHPDASACFHRAACQTDTVQPLTWKGGPAVVRDFYTLDHLLEQGHFIPSCTAVFRSHLVRPALEWTRGTPFLETAYAIRFALAGKIGYLDEVMATYRFHSAGVYGKARDIGGLQHAIHAHKLVGSGFALRQSSAYKEGLRRRYSDLGRYLLGRGNVVSGLSAYAKGLLSIV